MAKHTSVWPHRQIRNGRGILAAGLLALAGCSVAPIADAPRQSPAPYFAASHSQRFLDTDVLWGGTIIDVNEFARHSEIEIVAYPLDALQRPLLDAPEQGRFVALRAGSLDRREFQPGRFVTVRGPITGDRELRIRQQDARMPEVDARELVLWPRDFRFQRSQVSVSIGISGGH